MIPFAIWCASLRALFIVQTGAAPSGVLLREGSADDCCSGRLELTSDGQAFYLEGRDPVAVKVHEMGGQLQVEVDGKTRWVLSPDGKGWIDKDKRRWVPRETLVRTDPSWTTTRIQVMDQDKELVKNSATTTASRGGTGAGIRCWCVRFGTRRD